VGGLRISVIGAIGAGFYFFQFILGGGVEEVADAFLALMFDGIGVYIVGRLEERLGAGEEAAVGAAAAEFLNEFAGYF
jgi:hypothetical protein